MADSSTFSEAWRVSPANSRAIELRTEGGTWQMVGTMDSPELAEMTAEALSVIRSVRRAATEREAAAYVLGGATRAQPHQAQPLSGLFGRQEGRRDG